MLLGMLLLEPTVKADSECDVCGFEAQWWLRGFGVVCSDCKPVVMMDRKLDEEEDVKRL